MKTDTLSKTKNVAVTQNARQFAERLNQCLDETGAPAQARERTVILSKLLDISKQLAWSLLEGQQLPDPNLLQQIAIELEVDAQWLCGQK
jgi:hypothetical protein